MRDVVILAAAAGAAALLFSPRVSSITLWRAAMTPLASIIGSGFLVVGPILLVGFGGFAPLAMAALCVLAHLFGAAIRRNIAFAAERAEASALERRTERLAEWTLAFAYVISVAYYLNLFGAFAVRLTPFSDPIWAKLTTTSVFVVIAVVGWRWGFATLERLEFASVGSKLAVLAGFLLGLAIHSGDLAFAGELAFHPPELDGSTALFFLFGLIVTVQGFETSRYLGDEYDAPTRIASMRLAQGVAAAIYSIYVLLLAYSFDGASFELDETAIIDLMGIVSPVLPVLLIVAALAAQFSAAIADTGGSGGLAEELTGGRIEPRVGYLAIVAVGLLLTWTSNVFEIIAYASRAFALYYALESAIACLGARARGAPREAAGWAALALFGLAIATLGQPVEG